MVHGGSYMEKSRIIVASLEYEEDHWLGYDRQFCLTTAATRNITIGAHMRPNTVEPSIFKNHPLPVLLASTVYI